MGNKDSRYLSTEKTTADRYSSEDEDESFEEVFPSDPDCKGENAGQNGASDSTGMNNQGTKPRTSKKPKKKLSSPIKSLQEFLESCNRIPDYNSIATIEYARKFIHDGFSECSGDDLSNCLSMLLEYFYKNFEKINMYRDIIYLIYKDSRYTHYTSRVFSIEFEKVFQKEMQKISENSKWNEVDMFGALLCELLTIYQADTFLVTKHLSKWSMELIKSALEGNENGLNAYKKILERLSACKMPLKERFDHDLGVLEILMSDGSVESKTKEIYEYLENQRISQLADYECIEESKYAEEVKNSATCREIEKFLESNQENLTFDINLFFNITENEVEFFARKLIEVGIEKPQKIKFLAFCAYKFQGVLNNCRKIVNMIVKHLEEEIEAMRKKNSKNPIPINNFAKFIAELYVNERKIISPVMMTSWLSLLTELGESTAIVDTLKTCGYFYQIDEPENFDEFMNSISIFWMVINEEKLNISDQLSGKGQIVYIDYLKSRMYQPNSSVEYLNNLEKFLTETARNRNYNFDFNTLLEFKLFEIYNLARTIIKEISRPNANAIKTAQFLKSFFDFSFKIGKLIKRLKINFESRISEMSLDNLKEMKNVGKLIGELRNLTVIDKVPQDKWLEMIKNFNGSKCPKVMEVQLDVMKIMILNLLIHDEDRYMVYLKEIKAIDTSDPQTTPRIKSLILQITQNTVSKKIDKTSKELMFRIKCGLKVNGIPENIPDSSETEFDLNDLVKVFMVQAISNRFSMGNYTNSMRSLKNGKRNDFARILMDLCKDRFKNILNPELFDEEDAIGTLKFIRNLFKPSILTESNNEAFLQQMLNFEDFDEHKNCFRILFGMIKSVVMFTGTRNRNARNTNLKTLLKKVEVKLAGVDEFAAEEQEEIEIWHIVDFQGSTNERILLESDNIAPSQLAWSFTENYKQNKIETQRMEEKAKSGSKPLNLFSQRTDGFSNQSQESNQPTTSRDNQNNFKHGKNNNRSKNTDWNVTRGDLKARNDLVFPDRNRNSHYQKRQEGNQNWRQHAQPRQNVRQNHASDRISVSGSKTVQDEKTKNDQVQGTQVASKLDVNQETSNKEQNKRSTQEPAEKPKASAITDKTTPELGVVNVQNVARNGSNSSKFDQKNQAFKKSDQNLSKLPPKLDQSVKNPQSKADQKSRETSQAPNIVAAQNVQTDQYTPNTSQQAPNPPKNLQINPVSQDIITTFNEVMPLISSNIDNFKSCAVLIHEWSLQYPEMKPRFKELTTLITKELLLNHKQLIVEVTASLNQECDELRRKQGDQHVQRKHIFVTTVKAVMPFLEKCSFYNMLDDLLGQIKNGNQIGLALFLDLTEGMKEFLSEECRERDHFAPNCVIILQKAIKFKVDESMRNRTFEMFKFFEGQKVNPVNNWRDNLNSRMRNASSSQSISSSNASGGKSRRRARTYRNRNIQGQSFAGGSSSKADLAQKSGNLPKRNENINSKPNRGQKSDSRPSNVTPSFSKPDQKPKSITANEVNAALKHEEKQNPTAAMKQTAIASNSQKSIADNLKLDDRIRFYINQLDSSNTASIGPKLNQFLNKEPTKKKVLEAMLEKGVSDPKFINPIVQLFEFLFKQHNFKDTKQIMSNIIWNEFIDTCEKKYRMPEVLSNFAKFFKGFKPFLMNSYIFTLWRELLNFVKHDTPNVLENLIFLMTDNLDLFYETNGRKQRINEFVMILKEKSKRVSDKNLKVQIESIIKKLESGKAETPKNQKKETSSVNRMSEPKKQMEKDSETPAQKTKNLVKLLGIGDSEGECDLFNQIKSQMQTDVSSQNDQMVNVSGSKTKIDQISDNSNQKDQKIENLKQKDEKSSNSTENLQNSGEKDQTKDQSSNQAIQEKLQEIYLQNPSCIGQNLKSFNPEMMKTTESIANNQAKLIQGLRKNSIDIEGKMDKADENSTKNIQKDTSDAIISHTDSKLTENSTKAEQSKALEYNSTVKYQKDTSLSTIQPPTRFHPDDFPRPIIFTSNYILFDKSVENRIKFADILKNLCIVTEENKNSIEVRENIAKALIKLNYLKLQTTSDEFYDFAEIILQLYIKPEQHEFNKFMMLKFIKAWKFYEENVEGFDGNDASSRGKIYDKFSKSVCRIKKSFMITSDEDMTNNSGGSRTGAIPKYSNRSSKYRSEVHLTALTSKLNLQQSKQATSSSFNKFLMFLTHILTSFMTGFKTVKKEYLDQEAIISRRSGICQLICDLYLQGIASADFVFEVIEKLLEYSEQNPVNHEFVAEIVKNVGALLEVRENEKYSNFFTKISSKIHENPQKVAEIFEIRKSRYTNVENFTPIFLLFHENPGKFFAFIETLWKRLMENPENVTELSAIVDELLENLGERFEFLMSEFMENRRVSFEKIPVEKFSKIVCQRLKGSILFSFELFNMQILSPERFSGWFKDEVFGKLGGVEKKEISDIMMKHLVPNDDRMTEKLNEQFQKLNVF